MCLTGIISKRFFIPSFTGFIDNKFAKDISVCKLNQQYFLKIKSIILSYIFIFFHCSIQEEFIDTRCGR